METAITKVEKNTNWLSGLSEDFVKETLKKISAFQDVVKATLESGVDFGLIPGCGDKPALKKPGAEKIKEILRLQPDIELMEEAKNFDKPFFFYKYKYTLRDERGFIRGVCIASCNSKEKKYTSERVDQYSLCNTIDKMAQKRAFVGAALQAGALSNIYTQDIEDYVIEAGSSYKSNNSTKEPANNGNSASQKQIAFLSQLCDTSNIKDVYGFLSSQTRREITSRKQLTKFEASKIIELLKSCQESGTSPGFQSLPETKKSNNGFISREEVKELYALAKEAGMTTKEETLNLIQNVVGRELNATGAVKKEEFNVVKATLQEYALDFKSDIDKQIEEFDAAPFAKPIPAGQVTADNSLTSGPEVVNIGKEEEPPF